MLIDGGAAADVVEDRGGFHCCEAGGAHEVSGGLGGGEAIDDVVRGGEKILQIGNWMDGDGFVAARGLADGLDFHAERLEQFGESAGDGAEAEEKDGLAEEQVRLHSEFADGPCPWPELIAEGLGNRSRLGEHEREQMFGARFIEDRGAVGEEDAAGFEGV